jgi:LacI family transcriptional regulator
MAVRLKDIARDLGVSVITVSKVLRNHPDIGEETKARVLQRVRELNYKPNPVARALVTGRTLSIGLVVPDLVHPFFAEIAKGLSGVLHDSGYGLLIASSEENVEREIHIIEGMLARRVDALLLASARPATECAPLGPDKKTPCILIDRRFPGDPTHFVGIDDARAGALATAHLIEAGCLRIAHIRGPQVSTALGRLQGYREALSHAGLTMPASYVVTEATGDEKGDVSGYEAMKQLLAIQPRPDGVFCYNDPAAMGAMQAILEAGLRVPQDIAVIGCGNVVYAPFLRVPLSSIDQKSASIGHQAGEMALSLVSTKTPPAPQTVLLEPELVVRSSTRVRS